MARQLNGPELSLALLAACRPERKSALADNLRRFAAWMRWVNQYGIGANYHERVISLGGPIQAVRAFHNAARV